MNKVVLIGRLTRDPDLRFIAGSGKATSRFTIAVNRQMKKDEADFINCVAFGKTAETIAQYFTKGTPIAIEGNIRTGSYEAKDGTKKYTTDVIIERFQFLTSSSNRTNESSRSDMAFQNFENNGTSEDVIPIDDGDIPF